MNLLLKSLLGVLLVSLGVLAGCDSNDGPMEKAGKQMDNTVENAKDVVKDAGDAIEDSAEDAGDAVENATD